MVALPWQMDCREGQRSAFVENREKEGGKDRRRDGLTHVSARWLQGLRVILTFNSQPSQLSVDSPTHASYQAVSVTIRVCSAVVGFTS